MLLLLLLLLMLMLLLSVGAVPICVLTLSLVLCCSCWWQLVCKLGLQRLRWQRVSSSIACCCTLAEISMMASRMHCLLPAATWVMAWLHTVTQMRWQSVL